MPAVYDRWGVKFPYPENWQLREEEAVDWPRAVMVESPGGGFWSLHIYPDQQDCRQLADQAVSALQEEYDSLESQEVTETLGDVEALGHDMNFYCLDFLVAARVRCFHAHGRTYLTLCQAEDRDFEQLRDVFLAMTIGLLRAGAI